MAEDNDKDDVWFVRLRTQGVPEEKIAAAKASALRMTETANAHLFDPRKAIAPDGFSNLLVEIGKTRS